MMAAVWATGLATILRDAGLDPGAVAGWSTRGRGPLDAIDSIIVHHTASGARSGAFPSRDVLANGPAGGVLVRLQRPGA